MKTYPTLKETILNLKNRGFTYNFNKDKKHICFPESESKYPLSEFKIMTVHRLDAFEGPQESIALYAIESAKHGVKGYWASKYGAYLETSKTEDTPATEMANVGY